MSTSSSADLQEAVDLCEMPNVPHGFHLANPNLPNLVEWFKDPDGFGLRGVRDGWRMESSFA